MNLLLKGVLGWVLFPALSAALYPALALAQNPIHDTAQARRLSQADIAKAQAVADLMEQQARAAAAQARCAEFGVVCGPGATLGATSSVQNRPLLAPPKTVPVSVPEAAPGAEPVRNHSKVETPSLPDPVMSMALPAPPSPLPRFLGYANGRGSVEVEGSSLSVKAGDALPGGWTVTQLSARSMSVKNKAGQVFRLSSMWGTRAIPANNQSSGFNSGNRPLYSLPGSFQ